MDSQEDSNKDQNFSSHYEEDSRDSDIESRLYAEIHYTNTIIGDESNVGNDLSSNDVGDKRTRENNSAIPLLQSESNLQTTQSSNHAHSQSIPNALAQNNTEESRIVNTVHENPVQLQSTTNSNSKKRPIVTDSGQDDSNKKKKKQQNKNDNVNDRNKIINPYHKDVVNNQQYGMKLLSPAFLHLFFGKSKGKKKKSARKKLNAPAQPSKVNISYDAPALSTPQENVTLQNSVENEVIQNETEVSGAQDSETIIDICSESSKDSIEDNSKYNSIEATDKKLTKQNSVVNNENSDDDTSDSNESIFEVPVPPKPAPPVIELNDSDNENEKRSDTDSSSSSDDSYQANSQNVNESVSNNTDNLQEQENSDSESSEPDNLILNCTEIQKGVPSISDIKRMSHEISTNTSSANVANTSNASDNSQSDLEVLYNAESREKVASPMKEINSSVTKQVSKSPRTQDRQHVARDKSFFQPMSDKMKAFYNDSWGGENFDLEKLKSKMTRDPNKWAILGDDLVVSFSRRKRYFGMVCSRCQKDGHRQNQCPEPYKPPTCHMCGMKGHFETGCPEKKCLTCGKKQNMYRKTCEQCVRMVCSRCKARGHMEHFCPDLWRSYHQTVNNSKPNIPKNIKAVMKPQHSLYCCNCSKKGHDSQNCKRLRWSEHFPVPSHVISYDGPEYSKENVSADCSLNNSNPFCENLLTPSNSSDKTAHRNLERDKLPSFPRNQIVDADRNFIFKIRSKNNIENEILTKVNFNLKIPNKNNLSNYNYWNGLSTFLYELVKEVSGEFVLRQNNQQVVMEMHVPRKIRHVLEKLIQQYAGRSNFERSYMYLNCDRNPNRVIQHLTDKFNEISNMTLPKDILEMNEELISLKSSEHEQQQPSAFKDQKLIVCQKELLAALYREGCADNSLTKLKHLLNKIRHKLLAYSAKKFKKKLKQQYAPDTKVMVKIVLEYLFLYNNVFVPYEPRNLSNFICNYKTQLERRKSLRNNPLLFPQGNNKKTNKAITQSSSFSSTVTTENMLTASSSSSSSCQIPSLLLVNTSTISQIQPTVSQIQPMNSLIQPTVSSNNPRPLLSINTSISSNFHFSQDPPAMANNAEISSQNRETPSAPKVQNLKNLNFVNRMEDIYNERGKKSNNATKSNDSYKRFMKKTKKLMAQARDLNIPHVRKHVEILENKIKNNIYVFEKDVKMLKILVKKNR